MSVKITIQTMSTKCQYRPTYSTADALLCGNWPRTDMLYSVSNMMMPIVTWAPWKLVRTKNAEPALDERTVKPSRTKTVNSYTWPEMKTIPRNAVARIHARVRWWSPRWIAARASTIVSELISRTKLDTDVNGMSYTWCGVGPD